MAQTTVDTGVLCSRFDLRSLAGKYVKLSRHAGPELAGPCPRCGGTDRFFVAPSYFGCRNCHPKRGDVIDFVSWLNGVDFKEAVRMLDSSALPVAVSPRQQIAAQKRATESQPSSVWSNQKKEHVDSCRQTLANPECSGFDYLVCRGFAPETWENYHAGYDAARDAISLPWYRGGVLWGIRYRLLHPTDKQKLISEPGSHFAGLLFGGQALPLPWDSPALAQRSLVVCEGELNAMSIWQAANRARVDVLSLGSQSAALPDRLAEIARRYRAVIIWMDEEQYARKNAAALGGGAFWSTTDGKKRDANDHLQHGTLGPLLARLLRMVTQPQHQEALKWDLWDGGLA